MGKEERKLYERNVFEKSNLEKTKGQKQLLDFMMDKPNASQADILKALNIEKGEFYKLSNRLIHNIYGHRSELTLGTRPGKKIGEGRVDLPAG